nr:putative solute-binding protein [Marinobacter sp.]
MDDEYWPAASRAREFNKFTGSLEAMGAVPGEQEMRLLYNALSQPQARQFLIEGPYEVAGVFPAGAIYLHTRDRSIDSVQKLQGKRIATLDYDNASVRLVRHVGASVVGSNSANFAGKFNNGSVDQAYDIIAEAEQGIPEHVWMHPPQEDVDEYDRMLRQVRMSLLEDDVFDERAIKLMRAIRCRVDGARSECAS